MRTPILAVSLIGMTTALLGGCASVEAVQVTADNPNPSGIRVFAPRPYVVVAGSTVSSLVLPDCSREYAIQPRAYFAKNNFSLKLSNGMVTEVTSDEDATQVPLGLISLLGNLVGAPAPAPSAKGLSDTSTASQGEATLGIFEVNCSNGTLSLSAATPTSTTPVTDETVTTTTAYDAKLKRDTTTTTTTRRTTQGSTGSPVNGMVRVPAPYGSAAGPRPVVPQDNAPAAHDAPSGGAAPAPATPPAPTRPPGSGPTTPPTTQPGKGG